ncbi:MAG: hypothetical protein J1F11_05305 [Oscillospiraceae bacterium]|nr:hypothetical protein [Oscillospiraceae bacterium]
MRKKRILSLFTAAVVALCLAGCQSNAVDTGQAEQTNGESLQSTTISEQTEQINNANEISKTSVSQAESKIIESKAENAEIETVVIHNKEYPIDTESLEINGHWQQSDYSEITKLKNLKHLRIYAYDKYVNIDIDFLKEMHIESLEISNIKFYDDEECNIERLSELPYLKVLKVTGDMYNIGAPNFSGIDKLENLQELYIYNWDDMHNAVNIDPEGIKRSKIEKLGLCALKFSDNEYWGLDNLKYMTNLTDLLVEQYWKLENWDFLNEMTNLNTLSLDICRISDISFINYMTSLENVTMSNTNIKDFYVLNANNTVKYFYFGECLALTSEKDHYDFRGLSKLSGVKYLRLYDSYFKDHMDEFEEQYEFLTQALPDCEINWEVF